MVLCAATFCVMQAQSRASFGLNFNLATPLQEFNDNLDKTPKGISFDYMRNIKQSRLSVGGEIGVAMFFDDEFMYELSDEGRPNEFIELYEEDCYLSYHTVVRYRAFERAWFNPYVEGRLGGTSFFSTRMAVEHTSLFDDTTRFHGTSFNAGLGAGVQINFCTMPISLDLAALANSGTHAVYRSINDLRGGAVRFSDGQVESNTHHLNFRLGVRFKM